MNTIRKPVCSFRAAAMLALLVAGQGALAEPNWSMAASLYGDRRAHSVGDLLTIKIVEAASAKKDAQQSTDKSFTMGGSASFSHPRIDNRDVAWTNVSLPAFSLDGQRSYAGGGSLENKDELSAELTCRVMEVLPNGNLLIEGHRTVVVQKDEMEIILTGTVRAEDVASDNSIESTRVADAVISYRTVGSIADSQKKGIVPRVVDWVNPF